MKEKSEERRIRTGRDPVLRVSILDIPRKAVRSLFKQSCTKRSSSSSPLPSLALMSVFSFPLFAISLSVCQFLSWYFPFSAWDGRFLFTTMSGISSTWSSWFTKRCSFVWARQHKRGNFSPYLFLVGGREGWRETITITISFFLLSIFEVTGRGNIHIILMCTQEEMKKVTESQKWDLTVVYCCLLLLTVAAVDCQSWFFSFSCLRWKWISCG